MYPILYLSNEDNFNSLGEGILKDTLSCIVTNERNGQYDLELEYLANSRLSSKLVKGNIIKADAGKRNKGQLFRIYSVNKSLENKIKVYANHISCDLDSNVVVKIDIANSSCINALNTIKSKAVLPINFNFYTDITHTANFSIEGVSCLKCLGGTEGSIIDTYGNGANIVRDNFNISIMQNVGFDNNILISYRKNLLSLDHNDEGFEITGIYPFSKNEEGIDENTSTISDFIELPEKVIFRDDYKDFKLQNIIPVDLSGNDITTVEELRNKAKSKLKTLTTDTLSVKIDFLDKTSLDDFEGTSQLQELDLYDYVIVRHMNLDLNYKSKINKVKFNVLTEKYEEITIGQNRTNLSDTVTSTNDLIKQEVDKTNNFWKQCIEHATSQITGNSGGYVRMWPPNKPSEIFIMDQDNINQAKNVLRMNRQGIGFSKNGINGPFETAWTSDGTFYANWITAGILSAVMIQNLDGSLQIDLGSTQGIMTRQDGKNAIELAGTRLRFYDWDGEGESIGQLFSARHNYEENAPGLTIGHQKESFSSVSYHQEGTSYKDYITFDKYKIVSTTNEPITVWTNVDLKGNVVWLKYGIDSMFTSDNDNFVINAKNSLIVADRDSGNYKRLDLTKNSLSLYDNNTTNALRYCLISPDETFFGNNGKKFFSSSNKRLILYDENGNAYTYISPNETYFANGNQKYASFAPYGFSIWKDGDDILYTTVADTIQSDRGMHINGDFTVNGNKNCVQTTENYGDRLYYSVEDCESYLTDRSMELFTVEETSEGTYERVILLDNIYKESINIELGYTVEIIKQCWGDYRIKEQTKDYFIVESDRKDFTFKYIVTGKRKGFEDQRNNELFKTVKSELTVNNIDNEVQTEFWRLYSNAAMKGSDINAKAL